jgi:hypothetical protein
MVLAVNTQDCPGPRRVASPRPDPEPDWEYDQDFAAARTMMDRAKEIARKDV